jgi:pimeloyl-ACP methyl ester carboxylesterase
MITKIFKSLFTFICFLIFLPACTNAQQGKPENPDITSIYSAEQLEILMTRPDCLEGYRSNQTGPLTRIDENGKETTDSTFTVAKMKIPSDGITINGWLFLPPGEGRFPLVVLTNGGGDGSRPIKSLSNWIAPILAHCGIAAFVHDKRGTGESEGDYVKTTYEDYIRDAGSCAEWLSKHERINPEKVGIMGGSEGGRIAVLAANRYPAIKFVISQAGTVVSTVEDRLYAQLNGMKDAGALTDSLLIAVRPLWEKSFLAWASNDPSEHEKVNGEIADWRKRFSREILPYTNHEMDSIPAFRVVLPTWYSMPNDYLSELAHFNKKWLAIFGEVDRVVPTEASIKNILHYMSLSGNKKYNIAVIPKCGHAPVDVETKRLIHIDYLVINWLNESVIN